MLNFIDLESKYHLILQKSTGACRLSKDDDHEEEPTYK
jgi:hypothetical protein